MEHAGALSDEEVAALRDAVDDPRGRQAAELEETADRMGGSYG
jgi:hypothetical protein